MSGRPSNDYWARVTVRHRGSQNEEFRSEEVLVRVPRSFLDRFAKLIPDPNKNMADHAAGLAAGLAAEAVMDKHKSLHGESRVITVVDMPEKLPPSCEFVDPDEKHLPDHREAWFYPLR
jgi:hypothetical protein